MRAIILTVSKFDNLATLLDRFEAAGLPPF